MGARVSATGITKFDFGQINPSDGKTANSSSVGEASKLLDVSKGVKANAPASIRSNGRAVGSKVSGATKTNGGAL